MKMTLKDFGTGSLLRSLIYFEKHSREQKMLKRIDKEQNNWKFGQKCTKSDNILKKKAGDCVWLSHVINRIGPDVGTKIGLKSNFAQYFPTWSEMFQYVSQTVPTCWIILV